MSNKSPFKCVFHVNKNPYSKGDLRRVKNIVGHCMAKNRLEKLNHINENPLLPNRHNNMDKLEEIFLASEKKLLKGEGKTNKRASHSVMAEIVVSASHGFFDSPEKAQKWEEAAIAYLKEEFGEDNLVAYSVHYDERTPHIHAFVVPLKDYLHPSRKHKETGLPKIDKKTGKLYEYEKKVYYNDKFFDNKCKAKIEALVAAGRAHETALGKMHTRYAECMQTHGLQLERGELGGELQHLEPSEYWGMIEKEEAPSKMEIRFSPDRIQKEIKELKAKVKRLEQENSLLKDENITFKRKTAFFEEQQTKELDFYKKAYDDLLLDNSKLKEIANLFRPVPISKIEEIKGKKYPEVIVDKEKKIKIKNVLDVLMYCEKMPYKKAIYFLLENFEMPQVAQVLGQDVLWRNQELFQEAIIKKNAYKASIFNAKYNAELPQSLEDLFIQTKEGLNECYFKNKHLTIADYDDKITLLKGNPTENVANKMIDLALAKGWRLEDLSVTGSDEFVKIISKEIEKRMSTNATAQAFVSLQLQDLATKVTL